jgi:hypothetical protein
MKDDPNSLFSFVKRVVALRKSFPLATDTKLTVSTSLYGSMTGYTLVTHDAAGPHCRTVVVNMSGGGPWTVPVAHGAPECARPRAVFVDRATPGDGDTYRVGPYGKVVID